MVSSRTTGTEAGWIGGKTEISISPPEKCLEIVIIGIYKKVGYVITILAAISTDYIIYELVGEIGIDYQGKTIFGLLVVVWFLINEILSILENTGRMGAILPTFLKNILSELKKEVDLYDNGEK